MAVKARYNVSLPDHVSAAVEKHAKGVKATPTEYAGDIIRWWFGLGCPPVTQDEMHLRQSKDFNIWQLDPNAMYALVDEPVAKALKQLGLPNLFAQEKEYDSGQLLVAFDNHPTHWLVFRFFKGGKTAAENGLSLSAHPKASTSREDMLLHLTVEGKKMHATNPIQFSQIPAKATATQPAQ